ncbi:MAG: glycosyltransferase family 4 protein, partial [Candidatus Scalindua sp.]|nr:glycosyltransferase family 4 protein [Candidatus Scalindua sp.]
MKISRTRKQRVIVLVSDAYGGRGGIALYNRNFLKALCSFPSMEKVVAVPRSITYDLEEMPKKLSYITTAAGSKLKYLKGCVRQTLFGKRVDLIFCGHLHLLPFAFLLKLRHRCPVIPLIYGVEAWTPTSRWIVNRLCGKVSAFISIRKLTARRFKSWAGINQAEFFYLPNCIDERQYGVAPKREDLIERFGLQGKKVVMTAGRMDSIEFDRRKGFDEVLEVLPNLREQVPDIAYLIVGDGDDKERLARKADELGVGDIVKFSGYVDDSEKADYYRLADVFVMPGSNPIFDRYPFRFVFLEALACGVPVVGCKLEDESEANDADAKALIIQVAPENKQSIINGILKG